MPNTFFPSLMIRLAIYGCIPEAQTPSFSEISGMESSSGKGTGPNRLKALKWTTEVNTPQLSLKEGRRNQT